MNNDLHYLTAADPQRNAIGRFQYLSWGEFTGCVNVSVASGRAWEIVFYQGQIVWSQDLSQPNRLWQRLLRAHVGYEHIGIELLFQAASHTKTTAFENGRAFCWQYQGAIALMMLSEIKQSELEAILSTAAQETIFDLLQYSQGQKLNFRSQAEIFSQRPLVMVNTETAIERAEVMWQEWHTQKLGNISPNKTPVIRHPVQLYRQTTPIIYQNLVRVITGKRTLREIALEINEDLLLITRSLIRYIQTGIIELIDLPDLTPAPIETKALPTAVTTTMAARSTSIAMGGRPSSPKSAPAKLVICIDDNPQICELMRAIITDAGYRFIAIQDATQALPRLLETKPDLIFLDLIMPKVNGYEICGQIRRISAFTQIPIVILTGKDGLLDRVRAKVVGASEFTCKPITKNAIEASLTKYLSPVNRES
ncbi:response regulator [Chamaesiphon sp. VAR_48_metabat_403]|uniref:response regulator n=1 Tax=Chamaesiphon sp. VAR_48_metabat_403 TaxID=2964700 RepID=UPI00286E74AD|nr:response regulator [Chamaesiphon sp. VAR_48_metabat_403]